MAYLCADRFAAYSGLSVSASASRSSGVAPLGVSFDATATTDAGVSNAFRDLEYLWDFGDGGAGTFTTGRASGLSKNAMYGAVAGHVYESAGTYTPTVTVFNGKASKKYTLSDITVTAWANDANTICVGNVLPVQGVGGVPTNATVVASSDFDATISTYKGAGKRILFNKGDTFAASVASSLTTAGPFEIGCYGSGALPIVTSTNIAGVLSLDNATLTDFRVRDLDIRGNGATDTGTGILIGANIVNWLALRVTISEIGKGIICSGTNGPVGEVIQECDVSNIYAASGGVCVFGKRVSSAILGNDLGPIDAAAEHILRVQPGQKVAIYANTLTTPGTSGKNPLTLRAGAHGTGAGVVDSDKDTQYVHISDNLIDGGPDGFCLQIAPASTAQNNWISDVVAERNKVTGGKATASMPVFELEGVRIDVRSNLVDLTGCDVGATLGMFYNQNVAGIPTPTDVMVRGNALYSPDIPGSKGVVGANLGSGVVTPTYENNLVYAPTCSAGTGVTDGGATSPISTPNSSSAQIKNTDPFADHSAYAPAGYAVGSGTVNTVYRDYNGTRKFYGNKTPVIDMGAVQTS